MSALSRFCLCLLLVFAPVSAFASPRAIEAEVLVKAKLDDVWQAWTTAAGIRTFFAPDALVEARVDGPFEIYMNPYAAPGLKGADGMRVLAVQEKRLLSFTWNAPPHLPEARAQRTYVTLRFAPASDSETRVSLYHGGWGDGGEWDKAYDYFSKAWRACQPSEAVRAGPAGLDGVARATEKDAQRTMNIPALVQFLAGLAENNNRPWFAHNKPAYDILREEFSALVGDVGRRVEKFDPDRPTRRRRSSESIATCAFPASRARTRRTSAR